LEHKRRLLIRSIQVEKAFQANPKQKKAQYEPALSEAAH
jgi:hypothetical protein